MGHSLASRGHSGAQRGTARLAGRRGGTEGHRREKGQQGRKSREAESDGRGGVWEGAGG